MADSEGECLNVVCSFCKKPAVNKKVKCIYCSTVFHKSCSTKKTKKCCDKQFYEEEKTKETMEELITLDDCLIEKSIILENNLLKDMNNDLRENIKLLKEKIEKLESENLELKVAVNNGTDSQTFNSHENITETICETLKIHFENKFKSLTEKLNFMDIKINALYESKTNEKHTLQKTHTVIRNDKRGNSKQSNTGTPKQLNTEVTKLCDLTNGESTTKQHNLAALEDHQKNVMKAIINLESCETVNTPGKATTQKQNSENDRWQVVQRKKGNYRKHIGQSEEKEEKFKGVKPKIWMYIYKVTQETTEEDIKNFLKRKTGERDEDFIVKDLKESGRFKSYMIAADFKHKDDFYKPSFWPRGVNYKRFDFNKHYIKHNTRQIVSIENEEKPASFLEVAEQDQMMGGR